MFQLSIAGQWLRCKQDVAPPQPLGQTENVVEPSIEQTKVHTLIYLRHSFATTFVNGFSLCHTDVSANICLGIILMH